MLYIHVLLAHYDENDHESNNNDEIMMMLMMMTTKMMSTSVERGRLLKDAQSVFY